MQTFNTMNEVLTDPEIHLVLLDRLELEDMAIATVSPDNYYQLQDRLGEATDRELIQIIQAQGNPAKEGI